MKTKFTSNKHFYTRQRKKERKKGKRKKEGKKEKEGKKQTHLIFKD
jgi:hypothetical protein